MEIMESCDKDKLILVLFILLILLSLLLLLLLKKKEVTSSEKNFEEYKHVWNQVFFSNSYIKMRWLRDEVDQFWLFLHEYFNDQKVGPVVNENDDKKRSEKCAKLLDKLSGSIPDEWKDVNLLMSKVTELNFQHYINSRAVIEFRDILLMFVEFIENEKLKCFQQDLPIYQYRSTILQTIQNSSVMLIVGDMGCGKSTQVPQYLLQAGYDKICCTQPRRLACISLRNRVSEETFDEFGSKIGNLPVSSIFLCLFLSQR